MARKGSKTRVVIKRKDGTTASFLAKNKVTRKVARTSKSKPAARRVGAAPKKGSSQKQRDAAANARAIQKARKSMPGAYGLGYKRGRAVEGPAGPPAGSSGVASLTAPSTAGWTEGGAYDLGFMPGDDAEGPRSAIQGPMMRPKNYQTPKGYGDWESAN